MIFKIHFSFCLLFVAAIGLQSCETPVPAMDTSLLSGKWLIVNAKRSAKVTKTLNEAYFVFNIDSTMQTNFMGDEISGRYSVKGNIINQESEENLSYQILSLSKDSLVLGAEIMKHNFEFYLLNDRLDPFNKREEEADLVKPPVHQSHVDS